MESDIDEGLMQGAEHLKTIFDLCDRDKDGCISAQEFRIIGLEHFGDTQEVEMLIKEMDPSNSQHISFTMFCQGIESYILRYHQLPGSTSTSVCSLSSGAEDTAEVSSNGGYDSAFSSEDIYPLDHRFSAYLSNGYQSSREGSLLVLDPEGSGSDTPEAKQHTLPVPNDGPVVSVSRESPTLVARNLQLRYKVLMADASSQDSTPAEAADNEAAKLSDQLLELSSRLEDLREDQQSNEGFKIRLKRENIDLKQRLEEYETQMRDTEESTQKMLNESQILHNSSLVRLQLESDQRVSELQSQLDSAHSQVATLSQSEFTLKSKLDYTEKELCSQERELNEVKECRGEVERELQRMREQLKAEREAWSLERDSLRQAVHERESQVQQLQHECEELQKEQDSHFNTTADVGREISRLKKELELAQAKNNEMQAKFLLDGKELLARNKESLAAEMNNATKDEVLDALQVSEELNHRLKHYIDGLLTNIIEKHPELLEIH